MAYKLGVCQTYPHTPKPLLPPLGKITAAPQFMAYKLGVRQTYPHTSRPLLPPPWDRRQLPYNQWLTGWGYARHTPIPLGQYYLPWDRRQLPHIPWLTGWRYAKHTPRPLLPPREGDSTFLKKLIFSRKFKGRICCGSHLAVMNEILHFPIFRS